MTLPKNSKWLTGGKIHVHKIRPKKQIFFFLIIIKQLFWLKYRTAEKVTYSNLAQTQNSVFKAL